ncbi:hypothetical protein HPB50_019868 [Hyalomma asiaticum]|uniref:Uncharacterized protein n=1 Tax=Hyalomma asiaticum TaxID=266040 RepID=A0ACB7SJI0_HYAAI|nr:hypothetical protein HPB50_019868 [Hyalomma asiaticum]
MEEAQTPHCTKTMGHDQRGTECVKLGWARGGRVGERPRPQSPEEQGGARVITTTTVSQDNSLLAAERKRPRHDEQGTATVGTPCSAR